MRNRAAICLSFDDGRGDNTRTIDEVLIPMGIPCTVNITTGYIDGTCPAAMLPTDKKPMKLEDIKRLHESGMVEFALHGDRHINTVSDMMTCRDKLVSWLDLDKDEAIGFASPGSGYEIERFRMDYEQYYKGKVSYMRTLQRVRTLKPFRILCRKASRVLHWPWLYKAAYRETIMLEQDGNIIYSIPVLNDISFEEVKSVIDECIDRKGCLTIMFHSILDNVSNEDNWSWSTDKLRALCEYASKREVDFVKTCDLF